MSDTITTITPPVDEPAPAPAKKRHPVLKALGAGALGLTIFLIGTSVGSSASKQAVPTPAATVTKTVEVPGPTTTVTAAAPAPAPAPAPAGPATTITNPGIYVVGTDIAVGKYKTEGGGYFAILKDPTAPTGDVNNIVTNDNPRGQAFVTLKAGQGFQTSGDMTWVKVG